MDKNTLIEILKSESMLTKEEIRKIMDEELNKPADEIDADLVMTCLDALEAPKEQPQQDRPSVSKEKSKKIRLNRILLIAAVIILAIAMAVPASARFLHFNASDEIVKLRDNHFRVDLKGAGGDVTAKQSSANGLIAALEEKGVNNIVLPSALLHDDYKISYINTEENDNFNSVSVLLENKKTKDEVLISIDIAYGMYEFGLGKFETDMEYDYIEQINSNALTAVVFNKEDFSLIKYLNKNAQYDISLSCDFNTAKQIAQTIGED